MNETSSFKADWQQINPFWNGFWKDLAKYPHPDMTSWYYRVFLGAPLTSDLARNPSSYVWKTTESTPTPFSPSYVPPHDPTLVYPTATLDEASRRISLLYQNIISKDADDEDGEQIDDSGSDGADREILLTRDDDAATLEEKRKCSSIGIGIWSSLLPPHVAVSATAGYIRSAGNGVFRRRKCVVYYYPLSKLPDYPALYHFSFVSW